MHFTESLTDGTIRPHICTINSLIPRSHVISMGNGNKKIATFSYQKWAYTYTHTHPEFGEGGEEAAPAEPGVPVLGLFHNHLQRFQNIDDVIDSTTIGACVCVYICDVHNYVFFPYYKPLKSWAGAWERD